MMRRAASTAALLLLLLGATGCETMFAQSEDTDPAGAYPEAGATLDGDTERDRREVAAYLSFVDVLDGTDEQGWHTIFEHTLDTYEKDGTRERRLRLALVMSRADRKAAEPKVTRNMLGDARELFEATANDTVSTPPLIRKFARLETNEIDRRLALYEELQSLRSQLAKAHQASQTAQRDRSEAEARMRQIDQALAEANAKLEAVLKIERNIGPTGKETFP